MVFSPGDIKNILKRPVLSGIIIFAFSNCWYHPADLFDYRHSGNIEKFNPETDTDFPDILKYENQFQSERNRKNFYVRGGKKNLWLRMKLSEMDRSREFQAGGNYFEFQSNFLNFIQIYFPVSDEKGSHTVLAKRTGKDVPLDEQDSKFRNYIVKIPDNVLREEFVYIKIQSELATTFQILYHSGNFYEQRMRIDNYYFGIIYGILTAMLIYNVFVLLALKSKMYLYYVLHVLSVLIFLLNLYGQLWIILEIFRPHYIKILWIAGSFIIIFSCQFVRHFLSVKMFSSKMDRLLSSVVFLGMILFVSGLFEFYYLSNFIARTLAVMIPVFYMIAGIIATRRGFKSAKILFLSWAIIGLAFIGLATKGVEFFLLEYLSMISLPAAFAIESILYSLALANKLRSLEEEKEEAIQYGKRFEEMSYTDPLTGFFNRRYFESKLQAEILHSKLMDRPLGIILLDFDNFKMINDTYGHAQGDIVLKELSRTLLENKRREDTFCRYGGEEFACILPGSDLQASAAIAEKMRKKCETIIFTPKPFVNFKVTVSAGVTTFYPEDSDTSLLERADQLMYRAKKAGKNTIVHD